MLSGWTLCWNHGVFYRIYFHFNIRCKLSEFLDFVFLYIFILCLSDYVFQVQGLVNTFGDLRGSFAAVERINSVFSGVQVDDALAYGLERELRQKAVDDENYKLVLSNISTENSQKNYFHYMSALKTSSNLFSLAWSGDICLEGIFIAILFVSLVTCCFNGWLANVLVIGALITCYFSFSHEMNLSY